LFNLQTIFQVGLEKENQKNFRYRSRFAQVERASFHPTNTVKALTEKNKQETQHESTKTPQPQMCRLIEVLHLAQLKTSSDVTIVVFPSDLILKKN